MFTYGTCIAATSLFIVHLQTSDGTGHRDYVHVVDLAEGHVLAVQQLEI